LVRVEEDIVVPTIARIMTNQIHARYLKTWKMEIRVLMPKRTANIMAAGSETEYE
jgi:hypothetical protein